MESVRQRAAVMIMARCQTIIELRQELGKKLMHEEARGNTLPGEWPRIALFWRIFLLLVK